MFWAGILKPNIINIICCWPASASFYLESFPFVRQGARQRGSMTLNGAGYGFVFVYSCVFLIFGPASFINFPVGCFSFSLDLPFTAGKKIRQGKRFLGRYFQLLRFYFGPGCSSVFFAGRKKGRFFIMAFTGTVRNLQFMPW